MKEGVKTPLRSVSFASSISVCSSSVKQLIIARFMDAIVKKEDFWICLRRDVIIPATAIARLRLERRIDIHGGHV